MSHLRHHLLILLVAVCPVCTAAADDVKDAEFFERRIRPILVKHCYECHSEAAKEQQGGLLLDRRSAWLKGGESGNTVVPGEPQSSLLIEAVNYTNDDLQMPPTGKLADSEIALLTTWIKRGSAGPLDDMGETAFSRLGDQEFLFEKAKTHWAFQPVVDIEAPVADDRAWNTNAIDRFVYDRLKQAGLKPSSPARPNVLARRLHYAITGLPPTIGDVAQFTENPKGAVQRTADRLLASNAFGEHIGRMWLDVARYADTDSAYRPDTKTPHYFPFAFTYRDYVIRAFNDDKPFDHFVKEQLAADLMGFGDNDAEQAALGFIAVGPHMNRSGAEALDDWIDTTTRGFMGMTVACARCHDHKYEPIPTADYYSLRGVFASIERIKSLDEKQLPQIDSGYEVSDADEADFKKKQAAIEKKIRDAGAKKARGNNRSVAQKIRETELAKLLAFHPGAPVRAMTVRDKKKFPRSFIFERGEPRSRGDEVPRRFLKVLDEQQTPFSVKSSGRLELADKITSPKNPLTARVFVNRVWGFLMGSYLVDTPSDFGFQGSEPTHPQLLDWLAADFVQHDWSTRHLVKTIVTSQTFQQQSRHRENAAGKDSENRLLWRANRRRLSIEQLRDSMLAASEQLDRTPFGRPGLLWDKKYTMRRTIYGWVNRFNLDPTLRAFDFPAPMQSSEKRGESIVATQTLFAMNSPFVIDQAKAIVASSEFKACTNDEERINATFHATLRRKPHPAEATRFAKVVVAVRRMNANLRKKVKVTEPWSLVAQSVLMSNEFQYVD